MSDTSFIRTEMLPAKTPPVGQRGVVKWLRENLFAGPMNTILTLLGLIAVYYLLAWSVPWVMRGIWDADTLQDCRRLTIERYGEGTSVACWAMISERWHQFMFGFYPQDLYWRPVLAFGLLFAALAPVLYYGERRTNLKLIGAVAVLTLVFMGETWKLADIAPKATPALASNSSLVIGFAVALFGLLLATAAAAPRKLTWFTAIYPLLGFFLLWGGSVWGPLGVAMGFAILGIVFVLLQGRLGVVVAAGAGVLVAAIWWLGVQTVATTALHSAMPMGLYSVNSDVFGGFLLSFVIGVSAISMSLPIGILLALGRRSDMILVKTLSVGFIEFVRGVPLITMLFTASLLLQYFLPPRSNFDLILRVIILVTLFASAYIAEVIRGGLAALPRGQYEAADALGLDYWQAQRLIVMPQALKIAIPGIVSSFIGLFKDTTLVALVGLADPLKGITRIVRADINWKNIYWEPYVFVGAIFFAVCFGMSRYSMYLEKKLKTDHR